MKDYSKYFQNIESSDIDSSYGYITKLEVVGEEVHVWTPQTKKDDPRKYGIEELPHYLEKLEKQYQLIIENQEVIKKDYMKKIIKIMITIAIAVILPLMIKGASLMLSGSLLTGLPLLISSPLIGGFLTAIGISKIDDKFGEKMYTYNYFLSKRTDIEIQSKSDKNITENLSRSTVKSIKSKEELKESGTIGQVYDIDFMDKTSLKQLRKIITNYNQSKCLSEEQVFINPNEVKEEAKGKIRSLTPKK